MSKTFRVTYNCSFKVDIIVEDGQEINDVMYDINIPENDSKYVDSSFEIEGYEEIDEVKCDFETAQYNADYIISLAKYYILECPNSEMLDSANLCYRSACLLFEQRSYEYAGIKALKSLAYTIGIAHPDYIICKAKTE